MDEFNVVHLPSPPSSLQESLLLRHSGSFNGLPQPYLSSTPKTETNCSMSYNQLNIPHSCSNQRKSKNTRLHSNLDISPLSLQETPNTVLDSDNSDECEVNLPAINKRSNFNDRRPLSQSLPVTPRIGLQAKQMNGVTNLGRLYTSPHMIDPPYPSTGASTPYVTCNSTFDESVQKALHGSIDYSSLPLPKENNVPMPAKKNISRYSSEPTINHVKTTQRKNSLRSRKLKESCSLDNPSNKGIRNSFNGIEEKLDDLEMMGTQWKFIRTLVDELNKCRVQNNMLAVQLQQAKLEIQVLKSSQEVTPDKVNPRSMSELICQVHASQKVRDEAMMARITLANEERDAALTQTQGLIKKLGHQELLYQGDFGEQRKPDDGLSSIENELRSLRLTINQQDIQEKQRAQYRLIQELESVKLKLSQSEISRYQQQEKYSQLETLLNNQMTNGYHDSKSNSYAAERENGRKSPKDSSECDPKHSYSSLDSVETISVSSWKRENSSSSSNDSGVKEVLNNSKNAENNVISLVGPITEL